MICMFMLYVFCIIQNIYYTYYYIKPTHHVYCYIKMAHMCTYMCTHTYAHTLGMYMCVHTHGRAHTFDNAIGGVDVEHLAFSQLTARKPAQPPVTTQRSAIC